MIKNYLKIAWRNLWKNKTFSLINIIGLASGLACFILIALYVADELSYDRYHEKANRIYRINSDIVFGGNVLNLAVSSDPLGPVLKKDYPQVEAFTRLYASDGYRMVKKGNQYIREDNVCHADSTLFDVFTIPLMAGDEKTALTEPNTVIVSATTAKKYFGTTDVVGKTLETDENKSTVYKITGVYKDMPHNSHLKMDLIFSMFNFNYQFNNYLSHNFHTYIVLRPGVDYKSFDKNFTQVIDKYVLPQARQYMNLSSMEDFRKAGNRLDYHLMPLTDIHLHSDRQAELGVNGNIQYVYIFSAVALFVLLLACINFMNLSTARSSSRAKEVGIRKVLGTERKALIKQFLTESTLTVLIATFFALIFAWLAMPWFNNLSGKELAMVDLLRPEYIFFLLALPLVVGMLAGGYPAFFLSSFKPIAVLKGKINAGFKRSNMRNVLVVFQFATSIILIVGTIIVYRQLNYIQTKKLGFNKDQLLVVNGTGGLWNNTEAFKEEVAKLAGVTGATFAGYLPVSNSTRNDNTFSTSPVMNTKNGYSMQTWTADYDYFKVMGMDIVKGRGFSKEYGTDTSAMVINESLARLLGMKDPIGQKLYTSFQDAAGNKLISYTIIGVVKDFHFESMRQNIGPLCFRLGKPDWVTAFKVNTTNISQLVKNIERIWKSYAPSMPFSYQFLDESFDNMYRVEERTGKLGLTLAIMAIMIACLGLFGLATYMAEQRIKEIGVRKVLGASVPNLVTLLSKDFVKLVIIASVLAIPLSWWAMHKWLQAFAYRITIDWWVYLVGCLLAMLIAIMTVSSQAIKAALSNPVKNLRTE